MINSFLMSMQTKAKRIILTSATVCSFDYSALFMGKIPPVNVLFGENGDPLNNNASMLILVDHKKYGSVAKIIFLYFGVIIISFKCYLTQI
jgi:hypothetical protein